MIYNDVLQAIGHTPIIRLNKMVDEDSAEILVKFEGLNVGGSIKTRVAFNMIAEAEKQKAALVSKAGNNALKKLAAEKAGDILITEAKEKGDKLIAEAEKKGNELIEKAGKE